MAFLFILIAAVLASLNNFFLRRSIDAGGTSKAYLVVQLTFSFLVMILLNPVRTDNYAWNSTAVELGIIGGILLGLLMWSLGKALEKGPPGLTFAALNSSSVMPGIVMALLFGSALGHPYSIWQAVGSLLVILGLFWAGWSHSHSHHKVQWAFLASFAFIIHALFLIFLQWWALLLQSSTPLSALIPLHVDAGTVQWFMPTILFIAALLQIVIYLIRVKRSPKRVEVLYGLFGGIANGACTFFLILAPQYAIGWENAMIFPIFSVAIIVICNIWGQMLYQERVNWKANAVCVFGLLIGTITWSALS